jgi:hypothetical protein
VAATMLLEQLIAGLSRSSTVTVKVQLGPSEKVLVTVVVPTGKKEPEGGLFVTVPQSPVIVLVKFTIAPHWPTAFVTTMLLGHVSVHGTTVMVKVQLAELLDVSIAVQATEFVPSGKQKPFVGEQKLVSRPQALVIVSVKFTGTHRLVPAETMRSLGHMMLGGSMSRTVTRKEQLLVLPEESVAVQVTVLVPTLKVEPLDGAHTIVTFVSQLSVAVTVNVTLLFEHWPTSVLTTMLLEQLIVGFS